MTDIIRGRLIRPKVIVGLILGILLAVTFVGFIPSRASAVFGDKSWDGYFYGNQETGGLSVVNSGIPDSMNSANELINFVENQYNSNNAQEHTAGAYIILTMMGFQTQTVGKGFVDQVVPLNGKTQTVKAHWEDYVRDNDDRGLIKWHYTTPSNFSCRNTFYQPSYQDIADYNQCSHTQNASSIAFVDENNRSNEIYVLRRACANPIGVPGTPNKIQKDWRLEGTSDVNKDNAQKGQDVTFYHGVLNKPGSSPASYGWRVQHVKNPSNDGNDNNDDWTNDRGEGHWPTGSPSNVQPGTSSPDRANYATTYGNNAKFRIPDNANVGDKYCQRIEYSNATGPNSTQFPNNAAHSDKACVTVKANPPDKCKEDCEDRSQCTYLEVYNKGTYNHPDNPTENHNTRAHVEVTGVTVQRMNGAEASGIDIDDYAPDDSGGQDPRAKKRWTYNADTPTIKIHVTHQWHNDTGWHDIAGEEYTWYRDCHAAQCVVTSVTGPGPGGTVLAGKPVTIRALIRNNSPAPDYNSLNNPYLSGMGVYSSGVGVLPAEPSPPPGNNEEEVDPIVINAPSTVQDWTVAFSVAGADVKWPNPAPNCAYPPVRVYEPFSLETKPKVILDDEENPTTATFSTSVHNYGPLPVNGLPTTSTLYKVSVNGTVTSLSPAVNYSGPYGGGATYNPVADNTVVNLASSFAAGDKVCASITIGNNQGLVGPGGSTAALSGGDFDITTGTFRVLRYPASCVTVHNEPYAHFNGADVSAGGKFEDEGGSCDNPGKIETFSKDNPSTNPVGSGVHIGALAIGPIEGFNSANIRDSAPLAPIGLSFSNTENTAGGSGNARSHGGNLGGNNCVIDYYGTKPDTLAKETSVPSSIDISATNPGLNKVTKYYEMPTGTPLNISGGNIANNNSEVIYVKGDVKINGNITLADNWGTIEAIPSLYIIASGNIYIDPGVTQLDGIYIAQPRTSVLNTGYINTCTDGPKVYSSPFAGDSTYLWNNCRSQLVVNGAFVAKGVYMERSLGTLRKGQSGEHYKNPSASRDCADGTSTTSGDCAAEIFNFGSEQYLAQPALTPRSGPNTGKYDYITSLAPVL